MEPLGVGPVGLEHGVRRHPDRIPLPEESVSAVGRVQGDVHDRLPQRTKQSLLCVLRRLPEREPVFTFPRPYQGCYGADGESPGGSYYRFDGVCDAASDAPYPG
jgi:hypothetical protein